MVRFVSCSVQSKIMIRLVVWVKVVVSVGVWVAVRFNNTQNQPLNINQPNQIPEKSRCEIFPQ